MGSVVTVQETIIVTEDLVAPIGVVSVSTPQTIVVTEPGPQGPPGSSSGLVEHGSYASPTLISSSIPVPTDLRSRVYIKGNGAPATDPSLANGLQGQELYLFGCDDTNNVELDSTTNLLLSGEIVIKNGTEILLHWIPGLNKWVEAGRNEI